MQKIREKYIVKSLPIDGLSEPCEIIIKEETNHEKVIIECHAGSNQHYCGVGLD